MPLTNSTEAELQRHRELNGIDVDTIKWDRIETSFGNKDVAPKYIKEVKTDQQFGTKTTTFHPLLTFGFESKLVEEREQNFIDIITLPDTKLTYSDLRKANSFAQEFDGKHPGGIVLGRDGKTPIGSVPYSESAIAERIKHGNDPTGDYENVLVKKHSVFIKEQGQTIGDGMTQAEKTIYKYEGNLLEHNRKKLIPSINDENDKRSVAEKSRHRLNEQLRDLVLEANKGEINATKFDTSDNVVFGYQVRMQKPGVLEMTSTAFMRNDPPRKVTFIFQKTPSGEISSDVARVLVEVNGKQFDADVEDFAFFSQFFKTPAPQPMSWTEREAQVKANTQVSQIAPTPPSVDNAPQPQIQILPVEQSSTNTIIEPEKKEKKKTRPLTPEAKSLRKEGRNLVKEVLKDNPDLSQEQLREIIKLQNGLAWKRRPNNLRKSIDAIRKINRDLPTDFPEGAGGDTTIIQP